MLSVTWFDYLFIALGSIAVLIVLGYAIATKKFIKSLLFSAVTGITSLLILHFTAPLTGFTLELTPYTLGGAGVFGLPGVIAITVAKMIFGV